MTEKSRQKFKYLENEKSFQGAIRSILHNFLRAFSCQNCLRAESASLIIFTFLMDESRIKKDFNITSRDFSIKF